jgi:hypothetical protein
MSVILVRSKSGVKLYVPIRLRESTATAESDPEHADQVNLMELARLDNSPRISKRFAWLLPKFK